MFQIFRRFDERGAAAIEYALLAGVVALGILGSLSSTRTSLSGVFNTLARSMSAATASGPFYNPSNPRAAYWQAKTVASGPQLSSNGGTKTWTTTFSDGSAMYYTVSSVTGSKEVAYSDPSTSRVTIVDLDATGNVVSGVVYQYADSSLKTLTYQSYSSAFSGTTPTSMSAGSCSAGSCSMSPTAITSAFSQSMRDGFNDVGIWSVNASG